MIPFLYDNDNDNDLKKFPPTLSATHIPTVDDSIDDGGEIDGKGRVDIRWGDTARQRGEARGRGSENGRGGKVGGIDVGADVCCESAASARSLLSLFFPQ